MMSTMDGIGECYIVEGGSVRRGYVRVQTGNAREPGRVTLSAHRIAWMAVHGPIPDRGQILHRCDNRACIRAAHLYLGTNDDNVRDRVMRLRSAKKLSDEEVHEIRRLYSRYGRSGMSGRDLAARFGTSPSNISLIVNGIHRKGPGAG
jgi:hypothetical protein